MPTRKWKEEILVNTTTTGSQDQSSVTGLADGGFVITWRDNGPVDSLIRWQRYDATGVKLGAEQTIANTVGDQSLPDVVQLSDGNLWFIAQDFDTATDHDIDGWVYSLTGVFVRSQVSNSFSTDHVTPSAASLGANGSVAVYLSPSDTAGDIKMTLFNAAGNITVNTATVNSYTAGTQYDPDVAASPDGSKFVVTWRDVGTNAIRARVFNNTGTPIVAEFQMTAPGANSPREPAITWLGNDRFVATWNVFDGAPSADSSGLAIKYAIFNFLSTAMGPERLANSSVINSQHASVITALPDGGFVIAWQDGSASGGDTSGAAIRLQVFDSVGDKRGGEILVNTTTFFDQIQVSLATLADGRVIVSWTDGGTGEVRAQIIDPRDGIIDGTSGIDKLYGHDAIGDIMTGFAGADAMYGLAGADVMDGGDGADFIFGDRGDDTLYGGAGSDYLYGGLGDDEVYGGADGDVLYSSAGTDLFDGGTGNDIIYYSAESVGATINLNNSALNAGSALGDTLVSVERISGTNSADILIGDSAANTFVGNGGNDRLGGGIGVDTLVGGTGSDTFVFAIGNTGQTAATADIVSDFTKGLVGTGDKIDFASNLAVGGVATAATATQASINATTGVATFFAGSGTTMADALADIATRMTSAGNAVGEFAFFKVNATGNFYQFISDGVAGVGANDVLVQMTGITTIGSINLTAGDLTILT